MRYPHYKIEPTYQPKGYVKIQRVSKAGDRPETIAYTRGTMKYIEAQFIINALNVETQP